MAIPFTDREMERAWRENLSASERSVRTNALRLLLFYAVECGLKTIIMRRCGRRNCRSDYCADIGEAQHDINKLLDTLNVNVQLRLPRRIRMRDLVNSRKNKEKREVRAGQVNQMWRYGGSSASDVTDKMLEEKLLRISEWIKRELQ
ncbi:Doublecortin domain-containing protein [Candidatus Electrothrix laxa]